MANKISGIYVILNTKNGKVYIGQTQDFRQRWNEHKRTLNGNCHYNSFLQRAWNKYGDKSFKFSRLEYCDIDQLDEREQHHIDIYMTKGVCYNIAKDVRSPRRGISPSEETRRKLSEARKNLSAEIRRKMSEAGKGKHPSEETRRKLSEARKNLSAEIRRKMSEVSRGENNHFFGKHHSDETRRKISEANGNPSEETRRKMSEAAKHRPPPSEETRRKMSEAAKLRRARRRAEREALVNGATENQ